MPISVGSGTFWYNLQLSLLILSDNTQLMLSFNIQFEWLQAPACTPIWQTSDERHPLSLTHLPSDPIPSEHQVSLKLNTKDLYSFLIHVTQVSGVSLITSKLALIKISWLARWRDNSKQTTGREKADDTPARLIWRAPIGYPGDALPHPNLCSPPIGGDHESLWLYRKQELLAGRRHPRGQAVTHIWGGYGIYRGYQWLTHQSVCRVGYTSISTLTNLGNHSLSEKIHVDMLY